MHCTRSINKTDLVYWYTRHLCSIDGGVHLTLVSICALVYIYRSAIALHVAVKLICFTVGLFILHSKDLIIRTKSSIYMNLFILILVVVVVLLVVVQYTTTTI